jgi:hypothetical protein
MRVSSSTTAGRQLGGIRLRVCHEFGVVLAALLGHLVDDFRRKQTSRGTRISFVHALPSFTLPQA